MAHAFWRGQPVSSSASLCSMLVAGSGCLAGLLASAPCTWHICRTGRSQAPMHMPVYLMASPPWQAPRIHAVPPTFSTHPCPLLPPCRVCPGQALAMAEMKVFLAVLARSYSFTADTNTGFASVPMTAPQNGLPITVSKLD